jgi:hypothetical protein
MKNTNMPDTVKASPSIDLQFKPQDADTAQKVSEFMRAKQTGGRPVPQEDFQSTESQIENVDIPAPEMPEIPELQPQDKENRPRISVPSNREFEGGDPSQQLIGEALTSLDQVEVTDNDRTVFLKAVLNDHPARLSISLYNGQFVAELRSRSSYEQRRVFDLLDADKEDRLFKDGDMAMYITRMHYYLATLMVERINGKLISETALNPNAKTFREERAIMHDGLARFEAMGNLRWTSILNALRIFEAKCARMNTEAANEDFWKPQS